MDIICYTFLVFINYKYILSIHFLLDSLNYSILMYIPIFFHIFIFKYQLHSPTRTQLITPKVILRLNNSLHQFHKDLIFLNHHQYILLQE